MTSLTKGMKAVALGAIVLLGLSACVGIPDAGTVQAGNEITGAADFEDPIFFDPAGPETDANQVQIVRGFLSAATGQLNDYATARSYLTGELVTTWRPHEQVLVYSSSPTVTLITDNEIRVDVVANAAVDAAGRYFEFNEPTTQQFTVVADQDNQWRISDAPDGIMLADNVFTQLFSSHELYFYTADFGYLVPDLRWFPARYSRLTQIVSTLLDGPSAIFGESVLSTAFPEGTELAIDSVVASEGVAQVDLSPQILTATARQRQLMQAQLNASVAGLPGVSRTKMLVDRAEVPVDPPGNNAPVRNPQIGSSALVISNGALGYSQREELVPVLGLGNEILNLDPLSVFLSEELNRAAVRNASGVWWLAGVDNPREVHSGSTSLDPFIDDSGFLWWKNPQEPGIQIYNGRESTVVAADTLGETQFTAWSLSRDDSRLMALVQHEEGFEVLIYGVQRSSSGAVLGLGAPTRLTSSPGRAVDIVWMNELSVVYAWQEPDEDFRVTAIEVGGLKTQFGELESVVSLAPANSVSMVRVLSAEGELLQLMSNDTWQPVAEEIALLGKIR